MKTKPADQLFCGVRKKVIQNANPQINEENLLHLYNFIKRRYNIHLKKDVLGKPQPWTNDPVLQEFRFTNIRREHDRESKWLIKNISTNPDLAYEDKLLNSILFRLYNKHQTSELIGMPIHFSKYEDWDPEQYRHLFEEALEDDPHRVFFTGAFNTGGLKRALKWYLPKDTPDNSMEMRVMCFVKYLLGSTMIDDIKAAKTQKDVFKTLSSCMGIGGFLGYQMFVDMTYIPEFPFSENEFTVAGPGCRWGIDYLFDDKDGMTYEECIFWVRDNLERLFHEVLGKEWDCKKIFWDLPEEDRCFNVMSLENCFCELSKYIRAKTETGRPRKKYRPTIE